MTALLAARAGAPPTAKAVSHVKNRRTRRPNAARVAKKPFFEVSERLHDWAYLELADLEGVEYDEALDGQVWTRGLLIRRKIVDGDLAFFTTWAPSGITIEALAKIEGHRWAIEESFETAKNELGLDHNETRSWHGWRRHVSLVMLAFAMMATIRVHANASAAPSPKKIRSGMTTKAARPSSTAS